MPNMPNMPNMPTTPRNADSLTRTPKNPIPEHAAPAKVSDQKGSQTIATVERAIDVLLHFARSKSGELGVTEIANDLGMSKAAVHRVVSSLRGKGLLQLDEEVRRYSLGPANLELGLAYLERLDIRDLAHDELVHLSALTGETTTLSTRSGMHRIYVSQVAPDREVKMTVPIGRPIPFHTGSSSKAFLAFFTADEIEEVLAAPLDRFTSQTIVEPTALRAELRKIQSRGYATSLGERQNDAASVAAPIFDHKGEPVAVMSVCGPLERFRSSIDAAAVELLAATARISALLGHRPSSAMPTPTARVTPAAKTTPKTTPAVKTTPAAKTASKSASAKRPTNRKTS